MQNLIKYFLGLLIFLSGCNTGDKPDYLLSKEAMVDILVEVYLGEARLTSAGISKDSAEKLFKPYELKILKEKHIEDTVLMASYEYYLGHIEEMEEIMDAVIDTLSLKEQQIRKTP